MTFFTVAHFVALLSAGLLAGIFLGGRMGPSIALRTLPASSFVQFQQTVHVHYVRVMPILQILAVLSSLTWLFSMRSNVQSVPFVLMGVAAVGAICVFAVTLAVNVPINKKLMTWSASAPPENMAQIWRPWERVNTFRTILAGGVFALEVLVVTLAAQGQQIAS